MKRPHWNCLAVVGFSLAVIAMSRPTWSDQDNPPWAAPPIRDAVSVRDGQTGEVVAFDSMLDTLAGADVVFLGETHDDETTHRLQLAIYDELLRRRGQQVVLALEMFERDVQPVLDDYLAGRIPEEEFLANSRPWGNYGTAYRPLIERARSEGRPVVASNFPRPLRTRLAMQGAAALQDLSPQEAAWVPDPLLPNTEAYWRRVDNATRGHSTMMQGGSDPQARLYSTQSLWDNSMGDACAAALDRHPGHLVLHINGGFHSAYWDGTVHQLKARKPDARVRTVAMVPAANPSVARVLGAPVADFQVFTDAHATDVNEGMHAVYGQTKTRYRLHLPPGATAQQRVPLLVFLADDGLTPSDALDLWKDRLGTEAAIAIVEAPYRETQEDLGVGGRWFWSDTFAADIGHAVDAVERIWAYVARYYPIDPAVVCVAGEGTGATVAAAVGLLADRMDVRGVAIEPRQFAKLREFPLPLPELYGDHSRPSRSLHVVVAAEDRPWWVEELGQHEPEGLSGGVVALSDDPWELESQRESLLRQSLGLAASAKAIGSQRRYFSLDSELPRARHWARLHAIRLSAEGGGPVAVLSGSTDRPDAEPVSIEIRPATLAAAQAIPKCPGPFGGTTVLVVPDQADDAELRAWLALEENDPLARGSRFHRLRIATGTGERTLSQVLGKLSDEGRKNVLIVPATFFADPAQLRALRAQVRDRENQMTLQWLPGLGGEKLPLDQPAVPAEEPPVKHQLSVVFTPETHHIQVRDRVELPDSLRRAGSLFTLSDSLAITSSVPPVERLAAPTESGLAQYRLSADAPDGVLELAYEGHIYHALSDQREEYTRGFRQTRGIVGSEGLYLDGDTAWIARFNEQLIRFSMEVRLPPAWHAISQGTGTSRDESGIARWNSDGLMEQIYLVGGPLVLYRDAAGAVEALVLLREQDEALARKYLDATARYIEMYRGLIGPYPYGKFALVENFWETGYGMPSFTLLGSQVIRFPFILHSSYPHEILHNWWGNSVFVDYESGNWCEGLTAYLADHLVQEQRDLGTDYRRNTLQKYRNYVRSSSDFPLSAFRERHSAATEAVGYGKALMMNHMLRRMVGDDAFRSALARFYRQHRGQRAGFDDLRQAFDATAETDLRWFFTQWVQRPGAPVLGLHDVTKKVDGNGFVVTGTLRQQQAGEPYRLSVPVTVQTEQDATHAVVEMRAAAESFTIQVDAPPVAVHVDPQFDLFRLLDPLETPPSVGQIFGQPEILAILPSEASAERQDRYRELMRAWTSDSHAIEIISDADVSSIPADRDMWVLGIENRLANVLLPEVAATAGGEVPAAVVLADQDVALAGTSLVVVRRNPGNSEKAVGLISVDPADAFGGMARKLPHYGKYSYLTFEGDEPTNVIKGQWSMTESPLVVDLRDEGGGELPAFAPEKRRALAELPPVFSSQRLANHVQWLAAPEREGRGLGSAGLQQAAEYIAAQMAEIGLQPGGDHGSWFQRFTVASGPDGVPVETLNVVGILPGKRTDWADQSVVLGAHYDHLGFGWPDVREAFQGQLHPGADDNASGVAVLLELARNLATEGGGSRNLVFAAFSAEECGRFGSRHYVAHPPFPTTGLRAAINLDTVGRLADGKLMVLGTGTSDQWPHIFRGCQFVTGIAQQSVAESGESSDQMSFIEQGIPAVQIFTGAHADYHRPSDTADKIDVPGLVKVATFVKEAVVYLLEREEPLSVRIQGAATPGAQPSAAPPSGRRVLLGTVPDFDFTGPGVKVDGLIPDSPAAQAGLQVGDVIVRLEQTAIQDLKGYSEALARLAPGATVTVEFLRNSNRESVRVTLVAR